MHHPVHHLIEARASAGNFQPGQPLPDAMIEALVRLATRAPSAYNFQNWKFVAVRSPGAKARLKTAANGQQKVMDASVVFIVCGTLGAHETLRAALLPSLQAGLLDASVLEAWVALAGQTHPDNPQLQRDEAFRSASLAAMTLMLAAEGMGLATCAMSGFDADAVAHAFGLDDREIPVMLVAAGHAAPGNWPQKPRRPLHEVMEFA